MANLLVKYNEGYLLLINVNGIISAYYGIDYEVGSSNLVKTNLFFLFFSLAIHDFFNKFIAA